MSDVSGSGSFDDTLRAKLARNTEIDAERREREQEAARRREAELHARRAEEEALSAAREERHRALVEALSTAAQRLKDAAPEAFVVRLGSTERREEFIGKISTRLLEPARSLLVEIDLHDDAVLARWHSDLGSTLELWRLLDVPPPLMEALILQVADQEAWQGDRPPSFPRAG